MSAKHNKSTKATLENIARRAENQQCADCLVVGARWVSVNLGVFVCIDCSGFHRDLGTHISKIKSIPLDEWQPEMVEFLSGLGNKIANAYYEHALPDHFQRPAPKSLALRDFIQRKYEGKEFAPPGSLLSPADLLREGKNPSMAIVKKKEKSANTLPVKPAAGKSRHTSKGGAKHRASLTGESDHAAGLDEALAGKPPAADLLVDFWGQEDLSKSTHEPLQSFGYFLEPPSFRRIQEAKTAGAKEAQLKCLQDPSSLCLGPPTFETIFPGIPADTCCSSTTTMQPSQSEKKVETTVREQGDSFLSAVNKSLDQLSLLASR